jgi:hypothetical protein
LVNVIAGAAGVGDHGDHGDQQAVSPAGWSLMLPPNWWHIPLDDRRRRSVRALLDRQLPTVPRDRIVTLRRELTAEFDRLVERATSNGGTDLYVLVDLMRGLPVAASCVVTVVPLTPGGQLTAGQVADLLGDRPGDEVGLIDVAGSDAARVRRREQPHDEAVGGTDLAVTRVDVCVPVPGGGQLLLLSFSTPVDPIADAMVALFDSMAGSLRWRWS